MPLWWDKFVYNNFTGDHQNPDYLVDHPDPYTSLTAQQAKAYEEELREDPDAEPPAGMSDEVSKGLKSRSSSMLEE